ncbi:MAG: hypothetical protein NTV43_12995 [Methylococcales bacterium]|nr:hypothetical protein [Methylococcales bacterium]
MSRRVLVLLASATMGLSACVNLPTGPSVMVLPSNSKSFDQFRNDDASCRLFASAQIGGSSPQQAGVSSGVTTAIVATAVGAAAGAAFGGGSGAAIGAGTGLVAGSLVGSGAANSAMNEDQQRYDNGYIQCMYAHGHQVPVSGQFSGAAGAAPAVVDRPTGDIPPPPPGYPPPPPQ